MHICIIYTGFYISRRVHISQVTKRCLNKEKPEFELEDGHGDKREDGLKMAGMKTYLIKKILKQVCEDYICLIPCI